MTDANAIQNKYITYIINKLVRDKVGEDKSDIVCNIRRRKSIKIDILRKLIEEINELKHEIFSKQNMQIDKITEEIVDIIDVLTYAIQAWDPSFHGHKIKDMRAAIIQNISNDNVDYKPGLILKNMYEKALLALNTNYSNNDLVIKILHELCQYISLFIMKFRIPFHGLLIMGDHKRLTRGGFDNKMFLIEVTMPTNHHLQPIYNKKYKVKSEVKESNNENTDTSSVE